MQPIFLSEEQVVKLHDNSIQRHGGRDGIRDIGMLRSALAMPMSGFGGQFLHEDLFEMAAAYLYHLVQNHPFIDGNKRVGFSTAVVFLWVNGFRLSVDQDTAADMVLEVAQGRLDKAAIAEFLRRNSLAR